MHMSNIHTHKSWAPPLSSLMVCTTIIAVRCVCVNTLWSRFVDLSSTVKFVCGLKRRREHGLLVCDTLTTFCWFVNPIGRSNGCKEGKSHTVCLCVELRSSVYLFGLRVPVVKAARLFSKPPWSCKNSIRIHSIWFRPAAVCVCVCESTQMKRDVVKVCVIPGSWWLISTSEAAEIWCKHIIFMHRCPCKVKLLS